MILSMSNIYNLDFAITFTNESDTFLKNKKPLKTVVQSRYLTVYFFLKN